MRKNILIFGLYSSSFLYTGVHGRCRYPNYSAYRSIIFDSVFAFCELNTIFLGKE